MITATRSRFGKYGCLLIFTCLLCLSSLSAAETVRVATFNLYNYLSTDRRVASKWRPNYPKPEAEKTALRDLIVRIAPDILAVQEIGSLAHLRELQRDLRSDGIDYPHLVLIEAADPKRRTAVLSQIVPSDVIKQDGLSFRYFGKQAFVKRGLLEVVFTTEGQPWSLFNLHLKSRRTSYKKDPNARKWRRAEARVIAHFIDKKYPPESQKRFLILGDFNAVPESPTLQLLTQVKGQALAQRVPCLDVRGKKWTYYYAKKKIHYCLDGILASPALFPHVARARGTVAPQCKGSDHRLVYIDLLFE